MINTEVERQAQSMTRDQKISYLIATGWRKRDHRWGNWVLDVTLPFGQATRYQLQQDLAAGCDNGRDA
jgi:hypothetical protein